MGLGRNGAIMGAGRETGEDRRRRLAAGVSAAALAAAALTGPALADTTVNGGSAAVSTATVSAGSPDNISQTGTLTVSSGPSITINSSNTVTNSGAIQAQDVNGVTGILGFGGNTSAITNSGSITFNESASTTTNDGAGEVTGPFAKGSDRFGIRIVGPGLFNGPIANSGTITIQGNDSAGISVETPLAGGIQSTGAISVQGDRTVGIRTTAPLTVGGISVSAGVTAAGTGAQAISLGGDLNGGLAISSAVSATGYHTTARPTASNLITDLNANDNAQGGVALQVGGNLGLGLLVAAPPATVSDSVTDANGDGLPDSTEGSGSVTSVGSAPAIVVGGVGRDVSLGIVGTGYSAYGVVIEGVVSGSGARDGVSATGLQLGVTGGGATTVAGGVRVGGSLTASSYGADATALHMLAGASVPVLSNNGTIGSTVVGEAPTNSRAIVVEAGGSLPTILNSGTIRASSQGSTGAAGAIIDHAGSLTHLENVGQIIAQTVAPSGSTVVPTGATIAIDDAANTTGLSLINYQASGLAAPTIKGSILMGSGDDSLSILAGAVTGDLSFGAGANSLLISGNAVVTGAVTADGGTLALNNVAGTLQINNAAKINLSSLSLAAGSNTIFTLDPTTGQATELDVAGPATIATGAKLGVRMTAIQNGATTYALVRASGLTASGLDEALLSTTPYIYDSHLDLDSTAGVLSVTVSRKTAAELALPPSIASAYEPVLAVAGLDSTVSAGLLAQTTRGGFMSAYQQMLPEHSGGIFQMVQQGVEAFGRPLDNHRGGENGGAWGQEVNFVARGENQGDLAGYNSWGVGLIAGYELPATTVGSFGVTFAGFSGELRPHRSADETQAVANVLELGAYWRADVGPLSVSARVAGDYLMAKSHRAVNFTANGVATDLGTATGHWNGWGVNSRLRAIYDVSFGSFYLRPQLGVDFLQLNESAYTEQGGGVIDAAVDSRKTSQFSGFAGIAGGARFGSDTAYWGPELLVGYRDAFSTSDGSTTARYLAGGDPFTLGPDPIGKGGLVARFALRNENGDNGFALEAGGETRSHFNEVDIKLAAHVSF
jgi:hypothetical protein